MYFVLGKNAKPRRWIDDEPFIKGVSFWKGARITETIQEPLRYTMKKLRVDAEDHAPYLPSTLATRIPLFRDDLIAALKSSGVDNLDLYRAEVSDPDGGAVYDNYKAVNILGLVAAADLSQSEFSATGAPVADVDFERLVIDEAKSKGLLMFRLAESVNAIIVHDIVRKRLTEQGFDDLSFDVPSEIAL